MLLTFCSWWVVACQAGSCSSRPHGIHECADSHIATAGSPTVLHTYMYQHASRLPAMHSHMPTEGEHVSPSDADTKLPHDF
jgi:hypothetical protein